MEEGKLYVIQLKPWKVTCLCIEFLWLLLGRALYYISKAFTTAATKLEKIGYGSVSDCHFAFT